MSAWKGTCSSLTTVSLYKFCGSETWVAAYLEGYELGSDDAESVRVSRKRNLVCVYLERYELGSDDGESVQV